MERGWRDISPNCPRCGSSNTKFCYYNNYSLTQPRYFCKGCRRYWTKGGSLRNVPVGGGCRRSRRSRSSSLRMVGASSATPRSSSSNSIIDTANVPTFGHVGSTNNNIQGRLPLINSYGSDGDLSHLVESSTPSTTTNPEAPPPPAIDLAIVYANFLNQKGSSRDDNHRLRSSVSFCDHDNNELSTMQQLSQFHDHTQPNVDFSSIPDATTIVPSTQIIFPRLNNDNNGHNQFFDTSNFNNTDTSNHHREGASTQHGLGLGLGLRLELESESGLPPLPGESHQEMQWISSSLNNNNGNDNMRASRIPELEQDNDGEEQFCSLFGGNWMGPIDLPGFQTTSSAFKP